MTHGCNVCIRAISSEDFSLRKVIYLRIASPAEQFFLNILEAEILC